jgi:hypothetical protein
MMAGDDRFLFVLVGIGGMLVIAIIIGIADMHARGESWRRIALGTLSASVAVGVILVASMLFGIFSLVLIIPIALAIWSRERRRTMRSR